MDAAATGLEPRGIVGRARELARAEELIAAAAEGRGGLLLIEGVAGIGKTRLLREICSAAADARHRVLRAHASELEQPFGFGLARQAVEPVLEALSAEQREELLAGVVRPARAAVEGPSDDAEIRPDSHGVLNGLFWLFARLAERQPLLLALDDLHWADAGSQRLLSFLAPRMESIPMLVVATRRPRNNVDEEPAPAALIGADVLTPGTLGEDAVAQIVADALGRPPVAEFTRACLMMSGGNPFLLVELVRELREQGIGPGADGVSAVLQTSPDNVARSVASRLGALGATASALARAVAILDRAPLGLSAELAGIDEGAAAAAADALSRAGLLAAETPLRFAHPLLLNAVDAELPPGGRAQLHRAAARLLAKRGASAEQVAVHLLHTEPEGDDGAVRVLAEAGRAALLTGEPNTAVRLLRRALEEPPAEPARAELLFDLATMESAVGATEAKPRMREVVEVASDPLLRARALRELTWLTGGPEAQRDLLAFYEPVARGVEALDRELWLSLESARLAALFLTPGHEAELKVEVERFRHLPGDTSGECALLAWVADTDRNQGYNAAEIGALATRAARHPIPPGAGLGAVWILPLVFTLIATERLDAAEAAIASVFRLADERGSASAFASASLQRALVRQAAGDLLGCEADSRAALEAEALADFFAFQPLIPLIMSLADQGKVAEGEALISEWGLAGDLPTGPAYGAFVMARSRLRFAAGEMARARADLELLPTVRGTQRARFDYDFEARLEAALVLHALGETEGAKRISEEALSVARGWGGKRAPGGALRVAGLLRGGAEGIEMLREAVGLLEGSPARLWHARALVDLGAALRRANQRRESRQPLREGIELAEKCGAAPLSELGRRELAASGGRVPPRTGGGVAELTPSELRVAEHAAQGLSNPEIAQRLFVTIKTVEMHLSNAYRKLEIGSRQELAGALDPAPALSGERGSGALGNQ